MFWQSVLGGLGVLGHWQVWIALVVFAVLHSAWLIGVGVLMGDSESGGRMAVGCLTHMIGGPVFQSLLLGGLVLLLTPIMLGGDQAMPLWFFTKFAWPIVRACLLALVISFAVAFLPIVGRVFTDTPGVDGFIRGIVIFRFFSAAFMERSLGELNLQVPNLYPGLWSSVGYFALATVLVYACLFVFAALGTTISRNQYPKEGVASFFIGIALMQVLGLLPLFMYANHVTLAIQKAAGG